VIKNTSIFIIFLCLLYSCGQGEDEIDFSTQVKPIINAKCISCHGGVKKQGGFSLLFEEEALATLDSGAKGIVRGSSSKSEMIKRLTAEDPEERMPYEEEPLSEAEIEILTKWVDQGAKWGEHWAYQSIQKQEIPAVSTDWGTTHIDHFIAEQHKVQDLKPSEKASPEAIVRRVALDLIGLPADPSISADYINDPTRENYNVYVDRLLASEQYGEKWTSMWLDIARYADTKGYERDQPRTMWRYRDWLIRAFNQDMPYDQFITEQLAGDLLQNPTDDQYIATAFHRNTMTNDEGGTDNEEFRTAAILDRVSTTWEGLMGTSFGCVQCHSHPYDPFTHKEFYEFSAFFNNTRDEDSLDDYPRIRHYDESQLQDLADISNWLTQQVDEKEKKEIITFIKTLSPARNSLKADSLTNAALGDTKFLVMRNHSLARFKSVNLDKREELILKYNVYVTGGTCEIRLDSPDGEVISTLAFNESESSEWYTRAFPIKQVSGTHDLFFVYEHPREVDNDTNINHLRFDWLHFTKSFPGQDDNGDNVMYQKYWDLITASPPSTPIMMDNPEDMYRPSHIFIRGSWLDEGEEVNMGVPKSLNPYPEDAPNNRLGLAQWMMDPSHPLTSRTLVNRIWEQLFGRGLVETLEDIGTQGASATHQSLLDHLSYQMMHDYEWSIKRLIKEIVTSDVYLQSTITTDEHLAKDPYNLYYARMPRVRLSAEQIRDQVLYASGKINTEMYGPSVMPFQPDGVWLAPYDGSKWKKSKDDDQYRRAVYTYWKRTSPYPSMLSFDGAARDVCSSRRIRTNTPLQALVTLNDSVYIDLSTKLAQKVWREDENIKSIINDAYESITGESIDNKRLEILTTLHMDATNKYKTNPKARKAMCKGIQTNDQSAFAALVLVSNAIINLDEVITKS